MNIKTLLNKLSQQLIPSYCLYCMGKNETGLAYCQLCCAHLFELNACACISCARPLEGVDERRCGQCIMHPLLQTQTISGLIYNDAVARLIHTIKFKTDRIALPLLGQYLIQAIQRQKAGLPDAILPVPLHRNRLKIRGFNQAQALAKPISEKFNIPILKGVIERVKDTLPQTVIDKRARRGNLNQAFVCTAAKKLPAHIAVVDDVMTTGHTVQALSKTLLQAGVLRVDVWVAARAVRR